jgi:hypothetical protein
MAMNGLWMVLIWFGCVIVGAFVGYWLGSLLWQAGFELIGSAVALVGAGVGGILVFFGLMRWSEGRY